MYPSSSSKVVIPFFESSSAFLESVVADFSNAVGDCYTCKTNAFSKCVVVDFRHAVSYNGAFQISTIVEGVVVDKYHAIGNCDIRKTSAIREGVVIDRRYAFGNDVFGKMLSGSNLIEHLFILGIYSAIYRFDLRIVFIYYDLSEIVASFENIWREGNHAIRDSEFRDA